MLTVFWYLAPLFKGEIRDTWKLVFTHVIREICQNLYVKRDHESPLLPSKSGLSTQFIEQDLVVLLQLHNCWFSHDVTKIQTTKLSILLRFYFHGVLEQLKTNFQTNVRFKRFLGFVIEYAWISKLLRDATFTWRPRELSFRLKSDFFEEFCYLNSSSIRKSITLMFMSSSRSKFTLLWQNTVTDLSVGFRPPCWSSSGWDPAWLLHTKPYKFE